MKTIPTRQWVKRMKTIPTRQWVKRRFLDFRNGHTIYLAFILNFFTFTTVVYALVLDRIDFLKNLDISMWQFVILFIAIYVPAAITIGNYHLKRQMPTEVRQGVKQNPYTWYATEGKELLYNLPSALTGLEIQKQAMEQQNNVADILPKIVEQSNKMAESLKLIADRLNVIIPTIPILTVPSIPKFTDRQFLMVGYWGIVTKELQSGNSVTEGIEKANNWLGDNGN